jgi:CheY-like chemotaxis protein
MKPSPQPLAPDRELQVIVLEDVMWDAELIQRQLMSLERKCCIHHCTDQPAFTRALASINPDLILSDFKLPGFSGSEALAIAREAYPDVPFVLVSGAIGEETLARLLREGATDYVGKNNLKLLPPIAQRALQERQMKIEARRAIHAVREAIEVLRDTKRAFKSKALGQLREKLELLLETPFWR